MRIQSGTRFSCRQAGLTAFVIYGSLLCALEAAAAPAFDVTISTDPTVNMYLSATGTYVPTASGATLNVTDLTTELSSRNIIVKSASASGTEEGNITLAASITTAHWSSHSLDLDAYHSVIIGTSSTPNIHLSGGGSAALILTTNDGGSGGQLTFPNGGRVSFPTLSSQSLSINGHGYTLFPDIVSLNAAIA
jgi:hypothetical protein